MVKELHTAYRITDLTADERPRERMEKKGAAALSTAELLAILLRVGVEGENAVQLGARLLDQFGGLSGLQRADFQEVCAVHGLGPAKAAQIKAAIELGYRLLKENPELKESISSPVDAADLIRYKMQALTQEELWVILLDTRNRMIHIDELYKGSLNSSQVRVGELFRAAVQRNAAAVILAHNHPSGDPAPSSEDIMLTKAAVAAGKLMDIEVLDHLVIGRGTFVSLKERGLGFA
jgi:DNA repair protein RadC